MVDGQGDLEDQLAEVKKKSAEIADRKEDLRILEDLGAQMEEALILDNKLVEFFLDACPESSHSMYYKVTLHVVSGVHVLDACFFPFNTRALTHVSFLLKVYRTQHSGPCSAVGSAGSTCHAHETQS